MYIINVSYFLRIRYNQDSLKDIVSLSLSQLHIQMYSLHFLSYSFSLEFMYILQRISVV